MELALARTIVCLKVKSHRIAFVVCTILFFCRFSLSRFRGGSVVVSRIVCVCTF